jgi:hypothetical protein
VPWFDSMMEISWMAPVMVDFMVWCLYSLEGSPAGSEGWSMGKMLQLVPEVSLRGMATEGDGRQWKDIVGS